MSLLSFPSASPSALARVAAGSRCARALLAGSACVLALLAVSPAAVVAREAMPATARAAEPQDAARVARAVTLRRIERTLAAGKGSDASSLMPLLKDPDAGVRREAEKAIWKLWARSGNADADRLLALGTAQLRDGDYDAAIDTLSRVIDYAPRFAEAFNKRATARYVTGDLVGALDDLEAALRLVPDHFGSLAGYGHIYYRLDDLDQAIAFWERALAINPNLERIGRSVEAVRRLQATRGRVST